VCAISCDHAKEANALRDGRTTEWKMEALGLCVRLRALSPGFCVGGILPKYTFWEKAGLSL